MQLEPIHYLGILLIYHFLAQILRVALFILQLPFWCICSIGDGVIEKLDLNRPCMEKGGLRPIMTSLAKAYDSIDRFQENEFYIRYQFVPHIILVLIISAQKFQYNHHKVGLDAYALSPFMEQIITYAVVVLVALVIYFIVRAIVLGIDFIALQSFFAADVRSREARERELMTECMNQGTKWSALFTMFTFDMIELYGSGMLV